MGCSDRGIFFWVCGGKTEREATFYDKALVVEFKGAFVRREFYIWAVAAECDPDDAKWFSHIHGVHGFWVWILLPSVLLQLFSVLFPFILFNLS